MTSGTSYSPPPAFGRFKLLHQIGAGVLGPVFRTHDPDHERLVAVKAFTLDLTPEQASALASEFERLAALAIDAPCVAAPVAAGIVEFVPYAAVPYVAGESLDAAIRQYGPAPSGDAIRLIAHVADALDAAAREGVHHGSLHPRDIIVTPGETHVTGLGVAEALERVGLHGPVRRPYVAPERESGDEWGAPADIYSLAAIAYEVLTGRRALPGTDQPLPALDDLHVHDAAALREVIESALDADPGRRPALARDFAAGFAAALSESAGAAAPGERAPDRRARKPRTRPLKLPGLDEPLTVQTGTAKGRPNAGSPIVPLPAAPDTPPAPSEPLEPATGEIGTADLPQGAAGTGDIRYVPVTDPADAGETATGQAASSSSAPEAPLEPGAAPAEAMALPAALESAAVKLSTGLTPDRRLADELLPRADATGETVDAELAATLDRLSSDHGGGPTPAVIGLAILGPVPSACTTPEDSARGSADFEPAAETQLAYRVAEETTAPAPPETRANTPLGFGDVDASMTLDVAAGPEPSLAAGWVPQEASEQPRPYVRGKGAERRRPPSRYGRGDALTPTPGAIGADDSSVPRAFEQARPTPVSRPTPDFELLTRPDSGRPWVFPGVAGVAAGLILGLAAGYSLGTRNTAPAVTLPAQTAASDRPASAPVSVAPAGTMAPAAPQGSVAVPPAASDPAPRPAAALSGTITVTATQQANVDLDGERKGMTPRSLKNLPLGSHTVRVTRPGYAPQEQTVVLTAEEPAAGMAFTLRPASAAPSAAASPSSRAAKAPAARSVLIVLIESTPPGALIRIDGRDLGPTPLTVRQMRPGTHTIELRMPGHKPWSQKLTVAAGDNRRITASLERDNTR